MIKLTSDLLAVRTRSIINHDRTELKEFKSYNHKNDEKILKKDNVVSIVKYLKRLIVK